MAQYESGDGYPWEVQNASSSRPSLTHRISSISDISSPGTPSLGSSNHRDSVVSLPSPTSEGPPRSYSNEGVDISHVRLSSGGSSGIASPVDSSNRHSRLSMLLPETLRVGSPSSPTSRGF